ncbi:MAG TPA: hypothetical protein ENN99_16770 [Chloroflexi bacterium]|nr:hypothetical protein [Chloroflexota bacterium]
MNRGDARSKLLLIIGLACATLGQYYFVYRWQYVWDGVLIWGVALLSFGLLARRTVRQERGTRGLAWRLTSALSHHLLRALALLGGVWLALMAGWLARRRSPAADFSDLLWMWLVGGACFWGAFVPAFSIPAAGARLSGWLRAHWLEVVGIAALLAATLLVRAVGLEHIPANLGGDEGTQGVAALELMGPPLGNPFSTGWFGVPTMSFLAYGVSIRVWGASVAGLRALSALVGTAAVLTTFLLARELWGRGVAWGAAVLLAFSHYHLHFSRLGSNQIADSLFVTASLWLLVRGLRTRRLLDFALAGAVIGLGWYGYFGARLIGILVGCYLAWRAVVEYRFLARYGGAVLVLAAAALLVTVPLLFYYADYSQELASRFQQVSIFASGWLAREQLITGHSAVRLLLEQFWKSISAFNYTLDPTFWYHAHIPLLDVVSGAFFLVGLLWATVRARWPGNGLLLLWFWLALILGWVLTENPPSSQRLLIIAPAAALLASLGLSWLVTLGRRLLDVGGREPRAFWTGIAAMLLGVAAVLNLHYYFVIYTPMRVYGNPTAEVGTKLGRYLSQQENDYPVYFYGAPYMYWDFGTLRYMARGVEGVDVPPVGEEDAPAPDVSRGAQFVILAERLDELEIVRRRYPGGSELVEYSDPDGRVLYVLYRVEPQ